MTSSKAAIPSSAVKETSWCSLPMYAATYVRSRENGGQYFRGSIESIPF